MSKIKILRLLFVLTIFAIVFSFSPKVFAYNVTPVTGNQGTLTLNTNGDFSITGISSVGRLYLLLYSKTTFTYVGLLTQSYLAGLSDNLHNPIHGAFDIDPFGVDYSQYAFSITACADPAYNMSHCTNEVYFDINTSADISNISSVFPASCSDGIQNQNETGIDTGGVCHFTYGVNTQFPATINGNILTVDSDACTFINSFTGTTDPDNGYPVYQEQKDTLQTSATISAGLTNSNWGSFTPNGQNGGGTADCAGIGSTFDISFGGYNITGDGYILFWAVSYNYGLGQYHRRPIGFVKFYYNSAGGSFVYNPVSPPAPCAVDCFSNVLFLPGLMGSRLYEAGLNCGSDIVGPECGDKELWVSIDDSLHEKLSLNTQGKSVNAIFTKNDTQNNGELDETGIVDDVFSFNTYQSFIADLKKWKDDDKIIADYAFIPYDWRLSLNDVITDGSIAPDGNLSYNNVQNFSESFILKKLAELQANSRTGKVTIITHSNGGLVTKALIQKLKDTNNPLYDKIDKIIFVAVPQIGTPDAMAVLLHGAEIGPAGLIMSNNRSRQLSENMSSIYNLLPSASYFTAVDPAFAADKIVSFENTPFFNSETSQYGVYISNKTELKNYVLGTDGRTKPSFSDTVHPNIGNSVLYDQAENIHQTLDFWQPSPNTKVIQVAGWGEETIAGLDYKSYVTDILGDQDMSYKPRFVVDGDGTVVVPSALWMAESPNVERWWVDLPKEAGFLSIHKKHRNILEVPNLRNFIKSEIIDVRFIDPDNIIINNNSTLVSDKDRLHYTLHSPLTLGILDAQGRYTGQDPITKQIREEIPNVTYKQIGDVQFISAPNDITYTLKLQGYQQGSFSLDVDKQEGNTVTESTSFQGISSSASTLATMDISSNQDVSNTVLKVHQNGDGTADFNLAAKLNSVVTPPRYVFSGFSQPINDIKYHSEQSVSVFKGGSTIPIKFQLKKSDGTITQATSAPIWLTPQQGSKMSVPVGESLYSVSDSSGNTYKWDSTSQQYIYNWNTKGLSLGYWYKIFAQLDDGYVYSVTIGLK